MEIPFFVHALSGLIAVLRQYTQGDSLQSTHVGRGQVDPWGASFVMGLQETACAQAPRVTRF